MGLIVSKTEQFCSEKWEFLFPEQNNFVLTIGNFYSQNRTYLSRKMGIPFSKDEVLHKGLYDSKTLANLLFMTNS